MAVQVPYEAVACPTCSGPTEPVDNMPTTRQCRFCFHTFEVAKPKQDKVARRVSCGGCFLVVKTAATPTELHHGALTCPRCESTDFDEMASA